MSDLKDKPGFDEQALARLLEAAYVLQERNRALEAPAPVVNQEEFAVEDFHPVDVDTLRETVFSFGRNVQEQVSDESVPYRHRIYVGAALAILIVAFLIMAYRGTQDWSGSSHSLPQAAPSAAPQPSAQQAAKPDAPADRKVEPKVEPQKSGALPAMPTQAALIARNPSAIKPTTRSVAANQGNGSEELSVAERFLNGTLGKARDSNEAARWLWQAVSKKNAAAALLLSDLYLRGDGVPKSCDQARLLLDAAARKGTPGAGQRLRNLQAFGCQ